jgi:recombination protein RecT
MTQPDTGVTVQSKTSKITIANFLSTPTTSKFLNETLQEKKAEFVSNLIAMCDGDSNLQQCEPAALMKCALNATALNLPLNKNLGYAYVIPYKGIPSFQIGYKGIIQLAIRTGAYRFINATDVRENEITRNKITGELSFNKEFPLNKIVGYVAYLELMSGFSASLYMTEEEIEAHAIRFSKMYASDKQYNSRKSKWSDVDARPKMALKTVLKGLLGTYGLMTTEFAKAFDSDDDSERENGSNRAYDEAEVFAQSEPVVEKQGDKPEKMTI